MVSGARLSRVPRLSLLLVLGSLAVPLVPLGAQVQDESRAIQHAATRHVDWLVGVWTMRGEERVEERVMVRSSPFFRYDGTRLHADSAAPQRSADATAELARLLRARVGAPEDSVVCTPAPNLTCRGTMGTLIQMSEPWQVGDSAAVMVTLQQRYKNPSGNGGFVEGWRYYQIMLFLKRIDGTWRTVARSQIGFPTLSKPQPVDDRP